MYLFCSILFCFILGSVIPLTNAGLLDTLGGVVGLDVKANIAENPLQNHNYVPNFVPNRNNYKLNNNAFNNGRNNNLLNNNFNTNRNVANVNSNRMRFVNSSKEESERIINNNNHEFTNDTNNNIVNTNENIANGNVNSNRMRFVDPSKEESEGTVRKSIFNLNTLELTEKEKIAVQKFPELQNLLDKLKEMNKQKELNKQNNLNKSTTLRPDTTNIGEGNTDEPADHGAVKVLNGWKLLKKRKFFFKAQPVRPENEKATENEEVYFLD